MVAALDTHGAEHLATSDGTSLSDALAASLSPEGAGWPVARKDALGYLAAVLVAGSADDSPDRRRTRTLLLLHGKANNMTHPSDCPALAEGGVLQRVSAQTKATKWINAVKNAVAPAWEASDPLGAAPGLVDKPAFVLEEVARELATAALLESAMTAAEGTVETRRSHGLVTFDDLIDLTLEAITAGVVAMDEHAPGFWSSTSCRTPTRCSIGCLPRWRRPAFRSWRWVTCGSRSTDSVGRVRTCSRIAPTGRHGRGRSASPGPSGIPLVSPGRSTSSSPCRSPLQA